MNTANLFGPWDGNYLCRFHDWAYSEGWWPYRQYVCKRCGEICMPAVVSPAYMKKPKKEIA